MESPNRQMWGARVSLGLLRPTRRARSNPGLLCLRRSVVRYLMLLVPSESTGCKHPWRRPASGRGACRWRQGGFRPFFEMCTCRRASVHGLGKIAHGRHFADTRRDSYGGINHLGWSRHARPPASVAVVPKDSGPNVAVVPKDSWTSAACDGRIVPSNVAVLPNDGADPSPPPPSPGWNRRGIGRESALRHIVRMSPFCQSKAIQGGIQPSQQGRGSTITQ